MEKILQKQSGGNANVGGSFESSNLIGIFEAMVKNLDFIGFTNEYMSSQLDDIIVQNDKMIGYMANPVVTPRDPFANIQENLTDLAPSKSPKKAPKQKATEDYWTNMVGGGEAAPKVVASQDTTEAENENTKRQEYMIKLLETIAGNTKPIPKSGDNAEAGDDGFGLGAIMTALAVVVGGVVGYIKGYIKILKSLAEAITPDALIKTIKDSFAKVGEFFTKVGDFVAEQFGKIKKLFSFGEESKIGKYITSIIEGIKTAITKFFEPIKAGWDMIKSGSKAVGEGVGFVQKMIGGVSEFFGGIGSKLLSFGKIFKGAMGIMEKLAWPLTLIMAAWDGVKGFIEGFKEGGLLGGIKGAIKGIIESVVTAPLDLLKDLVSWILDKLGFSEAAKWLESFNFTDIMKKYVDMMFKPFEIIKNMFNNMVSWLQGITIPEIGFTIPIINKKVSIGPFHPFGTAKEETPAATGGDAAKSNTAPKPVPTGGSPNNSIDSNAVIASLPGGTTPEQVKSAANKNINAVKSATLNVAKENNVSGDNISGMSASNDASKQASAAVSNTSQMTAVVNNNSNTTTILPKPPIRNPDPSSTYYGMGSVRGHIF